MEAAAAGQQPLAPEGAPPPSSGMWAPLVRGEPEETLYEAGEFVLLSASIRDAVKTEYGPRDVADLTVATTVAGVTRLFSTFKAGVVGQVSRQQDGDLPAVVMLSPSATPKGETRILVKVQPVAAGADVAQIAKSLRTPMLPISQELPL